MSLPSTVPGVLGNTSLDSPFDAIIIGSGPGGCMAAHILTAAPPSGGGLNVLVLEAGNNYFLGLDDPRDGMPIPLFSNDELKLSDRRFGKQDPVIEPRVFFDASQPGGGAYVAHPDVNTQGRTVGGAWVHADVKCPRFNEIDFRIASAFADAQLTFPGTNFADWPLTYDELEPFYTEAERLSGVAGGMGLVGNDPFASRRSKPWPNPANAQMYVATVLAEGARRLGYHPFDYPAAINTRPYDGRPACVNCGFCSGYGCPNNSKGSGAVTTLRKALLTGRCQLRYNCFVKRLIANGGHVTGVEYIDADGQTQMATGSRFIFAASPIESARLCLLSDLSGPGLGNSSGQMGRNLMFHLQTLAIGLFKQLLHGERGQSVTAGISDFRGVEPGGTALASDNRPLGGIIEFGTNSEAISEAKNMLQVTDIAKQFGLNLKNVLLESPFRAHLAVLIMQAEDAPQLTNRVELDPTVKDVYGLPVPRITYTNSAYENAASEFYKPKMVEIMGSAGAQFGFVSPRDNPSASRHVMGTMRMGTDPATSVTDRYGKFHDLDNVYCADGSVFVTSSGYNPTLTLMTLALRMAANIVSPGSPESVLPAS